MCCSGEYLGRLCTLADRPPLLHLHTALQVVPPTERKGITPLVVPLARTADGAVLGLLRWPNPAEHPRMELPVVRTQPGREGLVLTARSVDEFIARALATEDAAGQGARTLAEAAGPECADLYTQGDLDRSGLKRLDVFLTRRTGMFPDVLEGLALGHLKSGTENGKTSALVTGEFYMKVRA